ncbi:MAG: tetratricopeptide repeat protein [Thermoanaerobaculia bacterium]
MKRLLIVAVAALVTTACSGLHDLRTDDKPYENPFYAKYLNTGSSLDAAITRTIEQLRENPGSAELHNTLGALLLDKGFPNDAEREFERAVDANGKYYQAWYNLGVVRAAHGDELGARRAFRRTVDVKPGHAQALFQLGMVEEKNQHRDRAVEYYAKAFTINPALMRVDTNPRVIDSKLMHVALLKMYEREHSRRSMQLQGTALTAPPATPPPAPSPQPAAKDIVTPAPPATQVGTEPSPVHAPAATATPTPRRSRGRARTTPPATETAPPPGSDLGPAPSSDLGPAPKPEEPPPPPPM